MYHYETLNHEVFCVDSLPLKQQAVFEKIRTCFNEKPSWNEFSNFWMSKVIALFQGKSREKITKAPIYRICQDLEARLGIEQGHVRRTDYRDKLRQVLSQEFASRYQFCKQVGLDEAFLSSVLSKKKDFSMKTLETLLDKAGYELDIRKKCPRVRSRNSGSRSA